MSPHETPHIEEQPHNPESTHPVQSMEESYAQKKEKHEEMKKKEEISKKRDEQIAKRNLDYPDLQEALKILQPQLRVVKGFLDGSLHQQRAKQPQNRIVMIAEFRQQMDELNNQIGDLRNARGMQFRTADVWASFNNMHVSPDIITLKPPQLASDDLFNIYNEHRGPNGAFFYTQLLYIHIDAQGFSLRNEATNLYGVDTILFTMCIHGDITRGEIAGLNAATTLCSLEGGRSQQTEFWTRTLPARFRSYGIPVGILQDGNIRLAIYIDLQSRVPANAQRYLVLNPGPQGGDGWLLGTRGGAGGMYTTNTAPPASVRFE